MNNQIIKYLLDIKKSVDYIENYLGKNGDFNAYMDNKMQRRAVEREFEIIGEVMSRIINKLGAEPPRYEFG